MAEGCQFCCFACTCASVPALTSASYFVYLGRGLDLTLPLKPHPQHAFLPKPSRSGSPLYKSSFPSRSCSSLLPLLHPSINTTTTVPSQSQSQSLHYNPIWLDSSLSSRIPARYSDPVRLTAFSDLSEQQSWQYQSPPSRSTVALFCSSGYSPQGLLLLESCLGHHC